MLTVLLLFFIFQYLVHLYFVKVCFFHCISLHFDKLIARVFKQKTQTAIFFTTSLSVDTIFYVFGIDLMGAVAVLYHNTRPTYTRLCNLNLIYKFTLLFVTYLFWCVNTRNTRKLTALWNKSIFLRVCVGGTIKKRQMNQSLDKE